VPVHLNRNGGEQFSEGFQRLNPQSLAPVMDDGETTTFAAVAAGDIGPLSSRSGPCTSADLGQFGVGLLAAQ
jgi:hypothetical protein